MFYPRQRLMTVDEFTRLADDGCPNIGDTVIHYEDELYPEQVTIRGWKERLLQLLFGG